VTEQEEKRFREYFARGGFMLVDDYHGQYEWDIFEETVRMGDAWEHADDPEYPAEMTGQAYRLGVNYVIYALTH
jgi:hypothetical protein